MFYIRFFRIIILFLSICITSQLYASKGFKEKKSLVSHPFKQKKFKPNLLLETRFYYGFLAYHHTELMPMRGHLPGLELSLTHNTFGKKEWQKRHHYPYISYNVFYSPLTGHPHLGQVYALYPSLAIPIYQNNNYYLSFRTGLGLGYITKHFHPTENYKNLAIGSHLNIFINLMLNYRYHLTPTFDVSAGLGLIHLSNGGMASPNYGINLPTASVALAYKISTENRRLYLRRPSIPVFGYKGNKIFIYNIQACYATKDMGNVVGKRYNVYSGSFSVLKRLNQLHAVGLTIDGTWDNSNKDILKQRMGDTTSISFSDVFRIGLVPTYEVKFSHLIANMGIGFYISGEQTTSAEIYESLSLKYLAYKNIYLLVNLKAHGGRAAFLGWGLGYRLEWDHERSKLP